VKFNFLQSDFSSGELSPRAQGHVDSDAYKAGLKLSANCAPTRAGSVASRAGLKFMLDGLDIHTGAAANLPVQHVPIHDGPYGDFVIEVGPTGIRMMDKTGVLPWNFPPSATFLQFTSQDGIFAYGDPEDRTVYLRSEVASGVRAYYLSKGTGARNAIIAAAVLTGTPATTNDTWTLSGRIAGDPVTAHIVRSPSTIAQDIAIVADADGKFSITFSSTFEDFYIQLLTGAGTFSSALWDIQLTKNAVITQQDTTAVLPPATFGGVNIAPTQERVRAEGFWAQGDFWVAFAGGPSNAYAGFALRWRNDGLTSILTQWTFGTLPCTPSSLAKITGANAVAVFQDRLWYGINLANGKRVIRASVVGFGKVWGQGPQAGSTGDPLVNGKDWLFQFAVEIETFSAALGARFFTFKFPCITPKSDLLVRVNNVTRAESADWTIVGHTSDYEAAPDGGLSLQDQTVLPGGSVSFAPAGLINTDVVTITRNAQADDPLDLNLASPTGKIAWLNVLRGLILGTTRNEKIFQQDTPLSLDPATGQSLNVLDESSHGADTAVNALDVNDRVLFVQQGRKVLRLGGISIASDGGLVSEDVGVAGEHLTKARVRSMCFLKSPVQRAVLAMDDGTGAVMTLVGKTVAFSRLTIPACFGGIYNVASLNTDADSELWVATENGVTLRAKTFESDILTYEVLVPNAAPAAPTHFKYNTENPLPPVMDGWVRAPLVNQGGIQYIRGLAACLVGQSVYALINGQVQGPYVVTAGGQVTLPAALGLGTTWVDANGARRPQEIYVGAAFPEHRWTSLPLEGGNPVGNSQNLSSRKPQLHLRFVDSYLPLVNGSRPAEREGDDATDLLGSRVTGDRRATELNFQRAAVVDVVMDLPLRMEVSAIFGGAVMNNI
jgi:hypothetical protein